MALIVVGWLGTIYSAWIADTRMDEFEARENDMMRKNKERDAGVAEMEKDLEKVRLDRNSTINLVEKLGEKVETLKEAIDHLAIFSGPLAFLAAEMKINISRKAK